FPRRRGARGYSVGGCVHGGGKEAAAADSSGGDAASPGVEQPAEARNRVSQGAGPAQGSGEEGGRLVEGHAKGHAPKDGRRDQLAQVDRTAAGRLPPKL
ncbi:unnamed protein product, partial [Ectocarpus sp. 4 AP-2014]